MLKRFHEAQIIMAFAVLVFAMFTYNNAPQGREQLPHDVAIACIAFLFGKFTNGFNRSKPTRWDDSEGAKQDGQSSASDATVLDYQRTRSGNQGIETRRTARRRDNGR